MSPDNEVAVGDDREHLGLDSPTQSHAHLWDLFGGHSLDLVGLLCWPFSKPSSSARASHVQMDFHLRIPVSRSHHGAETGTHCRSSHCELPLETCMDSPEKMQAESPSVSPVAFLSYQPWIMRAICVGQREFISRMASCTHRLAKGLGVTLGEILNISEKDGARCEKQFKEGQQFDATFPSNWDIRTCDECLSDIVHRGRVSEPTVSFL